ncbi:Ig-like domain-containing protein [Pseudomonas asplenii]|uniref:Ig-like domain-containing protein n=1 Tax=Pseudomonas asplenii TaxID=53407 RepID=UPI0003774487|nr:Ig-like domain-containing protein [Pseudomonas fuscovaginae]
MDQPLLIVTPAENETVSLYPMITGTSAANATVTLYQSYVGTTVWGQTTSDENGNWMMLPSTALPEGQFGLVVQDSTGPGWSNNRYVNVKAIGSQQTSVDQPLLIVTPGENETVSRHPLITGTSDHFATITLYESNVGTTVWGQTNADEKGNWSMTPSVDLPEGIFGLVVKASTSSAWSNNRYINVSARVQSFAQSGAYSFTVPSGVAWLTITLIGAGGGGGGGGGAFDMLLKGRGAGGGGGGGGAVLVQSLDVREGDLFSIQVGKGGAGGAPGAAGSYTSAGSGTDGGPGSAGGVTICSIQGRQIYMSADGGAAASGGGAGNVASNSPGIGGMGGAVSNKATYDAQTYSGGRGADGGSNGGSESGGSGGMAGNAQAPLSASGKAAGKGGKGGLGGIISSSSTTGQPGVVGEAGADGLVLIEY